MTTQPPRFDPAERRSAIRRTVWIAVGVIAAICLGFFVRAVVLGMTDSATPETAEAQSWQKRGLEDRRRLLPVRLRAGADLQHRGASTCSASSSTTTRSRPAAPRRCWSTRRGLITVQFVANTNSKLPWTFASARQTQLKVHPGKLTETFFNATNTSGRDIVGNAVPSVAPNSASLFFNKTECFCFTEQLLKAGETRRMPVRFVVDPKLPKDVSTLTLAYTFYENEIATKKLAESNQAAAPAS